jgi:hypothetical protein
MKPVLEEEAVNTPPLRQDQVLDRRLLLIDR